MRQITSVSLSLLLLVGSFARASDDLDVLKPPAAAKASQTETPSKAPAPEDLSPTKTPPPTAVPRRSYWCAQMLATAPARNLAGDQIVETLAGPMSMLDGTLAATKPRGLLRRFITWLNAFDEFHFGDLSYRIDNTASFAPDEEGRLFVRKVLWRLSEIERDVKMQPISQIPVRNILRGRPAIREYLLAIKQGALELEAEHPAQLLTVEAPPVGTAAERRVGLFWKDLGRAMFYTGVSGLSAYAALRGWQLDNVPAFILGAGLGVGLGARGLHQAFGPLRLSFNTYVDDLDRTEREGRQREYEMGLRRSEEQIRQVDAMLAALDADPATQARTFVFHGYAIELPIRNTPTFSAARRLTADEIVRGERTSGAYDPVLNRWVTVDQLFQFDELGEPTLMTFMREQTAYGETLAYEGWINDGGFMP